MTDLSLKEYINFFIKRKAIIIIFTLVFLIIGAIFSFILQKPTYTTQTIFKIQSLDFGKYIDALYGNNTQTTDQNNTTSEYVASLFPVIRSVDLINLLNSDRFRNKVKETVYGENVTYATSYDMASGSISISIQSSAPFDPKIVINKAIDLAQSMYIEDIRNQNLKNINELETKTKKERLSLAKINATLKKSLKEEERLDAEQDLYISSRTFSSLKLTLKKLHFINDFDLQSIMDLKYLAEPTQENTLSLSKRLQTIIIMGIAGLILSMFCIVVFELWRKIEINEK